MIDATVMRAMDRHNAAEDDSERCAFCGELRAPHEFEDGLRCVYCAEKDEEA